MFNRDEKITELMKETHNRTDMLAKLGRTLDKDLTFTERMEVVACMDENIRFIKKYNKILQITINME